MGVLTPEAAERFTCFGGTCSVLVQGAGPAGPPAIAAQRVKRRMLEWHAQFSRFEPSSELSRLNGDPRECVPVSAMMSRFLEAALDAAAITGGLVDPTLVTELEDAGYGQDFARLPVTREAAGQRPPSCRAAGPSRACRWRRVAVDARAGTVTRPVGVRFDSGGVAKGLFGDVLASLLGWHESFAVAAAGDIRFGGASGAPRQVHITSPFDADHVLHTFELARGAVATSGTTKRSWTDAHGRPAHHLLDPATGQPAFTGVVQATALAPSGVEAEALAKVALLSGTDGAGWLGHGGVLVYEDGSYDVIEPELAQ